MSGLPVGDLPGGWQQIAAASSDFDVDAAAGSFRSVYTNMTDYDNFVNETGTSWYADDHVSVSGSVLVMDGSYDSGTSKFKTGTVMPNKFIGQIYGRVMVKLRVTGVSFPGGGSSGQKIAFLWWPASNVEAEGEIDFPECGFTAGLPQLNIHSFVFNSTLNTYPTVRSSQGAVSVVSSAWQVFDLRWTPAGISAFIDGVQLGTTYTGTDGNPTTPMVFRLQHEGGQNAIATSSTAHVEIDWVSMYNYVPSHFDLSKLRGAATPVGGVNANFQLSRLRGAATIPLSASMSAPANAEPYSTVTLDASASVGTSFVFTRLDSGGPAITLAGSGAVRIYEAPALTESWDVRWRVTVSRAGFPDATADVTVHHYPVTDYVLNDRLVGWVPAPAVYRM